MKTGSYSNNRSFVSALAAAAITTVLVSALVESFEPAQLLRFNEDSATAQIAAADARKSDAHVREA